MNKKLMSHSICLTLMVLLLNAPASFGTETKIQPHTGYATWYADYFHGRRTANGEIYHKDKFTAAHRTLPFGTMVKVTNLDNNKSCIVKINDRCGNNPKMTIDLSKAAAAEIGMISAGIQKVRLEIIE